MRRAGIVILLFVLAAGCSLPAPQPATTPTATTPTTTPTPTTPPPAYEPRFEGDLAFDHVRAQIEHENGTPLYRIPGTEGNEIVAGYIQRTMEGLGYNVTLHHFSAFYGCERVSMRNVIAERAGTSGRIVAFAAHFDTRPVSDKDPDESRRGEPVLGANDGGSGVGVLLELARVLPASNDTVRFLFFDGEDGGGRWSGCDTDWILGSRAYADSLPEAEVARFDALVLVDMIGDHDLVIPKEGNSAGFAPAAAIQDAIYEQAAALQLETHFPDRLGLGITDDHVPFLERMVPAVDLIHTIPGDPRVFPSWHHTASDDLTTVSAPSLSAVGRTLEAWFATRAQA